MLLYKEECGFHNFSDSEAEQAAKEGWVDGEPIRQKLLDAKRGVSSPAESATIVEAPKRGRPRKE